MRADQILGCASLVALQPTETRSCRILPRAKLGRVLHKIRVPDKKLKTKGNVGQDGRFSKQFQCLFAFRDVGQQNVHKRMLAVESLSALVLGDGNSLNRR